MSRLAAIKPARQARDESMREAGAARKLSMGAAHGGARATTERLALKAPRAIIDHMRLKFIAPLVVAGFAAAPTAGAAQDGSLARCGSLSAPVADVIHHCRRALSQGGLSKTQEFAVNLNLADALLSAGRPGPARDAFAAAAATGLERVELYIGRAEAEEDLGDQAAAAADLDRALALAPSSIDVRLARGAFHLRAGRSEAALAEFDAAVQLDAQNVDARFNRGLTLIALGRGAAAVSDFTAVIHGDPSDSGAYFQRARAREATDPAGALADFDQAIVLSPEWGAPFVASGILLDRLARTEEANRRFRRAFELGVKDPWLLERIRSLGR